MLRLFIFIFLSFVGMCSPVLSDEYFPWGAEIALVALPFLYCGNLFCKNNIFEHKKRFLFAGIGLILWTVLIFLGFYLELAAHYWPGFYLVLFEGMIASFVIICFSQMADKISVVNKVFRWIGKHSLIVMIVHSFDMRYGHWEKIFGDSFVHEWYFVLIVRIGLVLGVTAVVSLLIKLISSKANVQKKLPAGK